MKLASHSVATSAFWPAQPVGVARSASPLQDGAGLQKLLIPVKNGNDAHRAIAYAIRRRATGERIAVCLLHVEERGRAGQTHGEMLDHGFAETARAVHHRPFDKALRLLLGLDIDVAAYIRKGAVAFAILDAAEELDCQEIVMPAPHAGLFRWWSRNVVDTLRARQRAARVVAVSKDGTVLSP